MDDLLLHPSFKRIFQAAIFEKKHESETFHYRLERCLYSELFWSIFSRIRNEYGEIRSISPYLVRMRENTDQNNSVYRHFLRSAYDKWI